jgi:tRNA modification GTPase
MRGEAETICAVASAVGGAVGMVRLSGPRAPELLGRVCRLPRLEARRMHAASLRAPQSGEVLDRVLVCYMPAPHSYTGEDVVEVHGHGGELNLGRILSLFIGLGARQAAPGEFTRRAFLNGRLDLTQAEAVAQVVAARSERALRNAQAVLGGALGRRLRGLQRGAVELCGLLEAAIDFADETAEELGEDELDRRHLALAGEIELLARTYRQGQRLDGVRVALVGPVNAGKSSLFNCLLGRDRALVADEPGTTRDYLEAEASWDGHRVTLLDTAGERPESALTPLERAGRALAAPVLTGCDLWVQVVDASLDGEMERVTWSEDTPPVVVAANKVDQITTSRRASLGPDLVQTSAVSGEGLETLRRRVLEALFPSEGEAETVQVTLQRQWQGLVNAAGALRKGHDALRAGAPPEVVVEHGREALEALDAVTGERSTEAVLDAVFARFCVGK